jgi:SAM-dependent methyltransferase
MFSRDTKKLIDLALLADGIGCFRESVAFSRKKNAPCSAGAAVSDRRMFVQRPAETGLLITTFEMVSSGRYTEIFSEVLRVLRPGGRFLSVWEADDPADND